MKKGELDVYDLITRPKKKFEKSIMVAGGISHNGVGKLMLLNGTENEFCYAQAILNYKKDVQRLNKNLIFDQEGAKSQGIHQAVHGIGGVHQSQDALLFVAGRRFSCRPEIHAHGNEAGGGLP